MFAIEDETTQIIDIAVAVIIVAITTLKPIASKVIEPP